MLHVVESRKSVQEIARKFKEVCAKQQFGLLGMIDLGEKLRDKGLPFEPECLVFEVCNPNQAKKVLDQNMAISVTLPCRISVYQENGVTKIATLKPTALLGLFPSEELQPVAREVEQTMFRIIDDLT